jgi:hypothetical protein
VKEEEEEEDAELGPESRNRIKSNLKLK